MEAEQQTEKTKSKKPIANARVGIIDKETGEVIDEGSLIYVPQKVRIGRFFMGMQDGFEYLAKSNLKSEALNVLLLMISRMDYENIIRVSQKEIGDVLGMKKQNVSRAMKTLRVAGVIDPGEFHAVHLSPDIGWRGKVTNMRKQQAKLSKESMERTSSSVDEVDVSTLSKLSESVAAPF
jgi:hypothetical protein